MSSIEELKVIRLYRAFNTVIQLCHDRGYTIRHPSAIVEALTDPAVYNEQEGLDYDWFLRHFVLTPTDAAAAGAQRKNGEEENSEEAAERLARAANGEWIAMRNAMRLSCSRHHPQSPGHRGSQGATSSSSPTRLSTASSTAGDGDKNALLVFFSGASVLTIKEVQEFREKALKKRAGSMIVVGGKIGQAVRRDVQELSGRLDATTGQELLRIQVFEEEALAFNPARHETVPQHVALTPAEAQVFLAERHLNLSQLPRVLETDAMVQYLGLPRGSIVRIERDAKESGPYDMYRQVI